MQSLVGLSRTFHDVPELRDRLCTPAAGDRLSFKLLRGRRTDAVVFAVDPSRAYDASLVLEATEELLRGTPVFAVLLGPEDSPPGNLWDTLTGRCVAFAALDDELDCAQRIVDALEDHLLGLAAPSTQPNTIARFGEWLHADLAACGIADHSTLRQLAERAGGYSDAARSLLERADASEALMEGDVEKAVHTLRRVIGDFQPDWSTRYALGRLLAARSRTDAEALEAVDQLDRAFYAVAHHAPATEDQPILFGQASCLLALVRVKRRRFEASAAQADLDELSSLPTAPGTSFARLVEIEQIRLDGRRGPAGLAEVSAGLLDLLWRSPATVVRLVNSVDLAAVRDEVEQTVLAAVDAELRRAERAAVHPAPADQPANVRGAVAAARTFAREAAGQLRVHCELVGPLVDQSVDPPRWLVDRRRDAVGPDREEVEELEHRRAERVAEALPSAERCGVSPAVFTPGAAAAEQTEVRQSLERAVEGLRLAKAARLHLVTTQPSLPIPPEPARLAVGALAGLAAVAFLVAVIGTGQPLYLIGGLLGLGIAAFCYGPWLLARRRSDEHARRVREADQAMERVHAAGQPLAVVVRALDSVATLDRTIAKARAALAESSRLLAAAESTQQQAATILRPNGDRAEDFAAALAERMRAFNRAFAVHPRFWWPQVADELSPRPGDLIQIDESSGAERGLLSGWPGDRLVRVVAAERALAVSDLWSVYPGDDRRPVALERALRGFLGP